MYITGYISQHYRVPYRRIHFLTHYIALHSPFALDWYITLTHVITLAILVLYILRALLPKNITYPNRFTVKAYICSLQWNVH